MWQKDAIGSTMNKQRREHSHPSYVCFSAAHDFAVGDVGAVYKILFINSYTIQNTSTSKGTPHCKWLTAQIFCRKKIVCDVTKFA